MGHHVNVHTSYYRQNIIERDVPQFLRFLETATTSFEENNWKRVETFTNLNSTTEISSTEDDFITQNNSDTCVNTEDTPGK